MEEMMNAQNTRFILALLLAALVVGCSSKPQDDTQQPKQESSAKTKKTAAAELKAGREALQTMYASARIWAGDAQPVSLTSNPRKGDSAGKAAVWGASFASADKKAIRNFSWSGATGEDAPESGVSQGSIDVYSPNNASTRPFDMNFLKVDSTDAYAMAQKHGGATFLKKTPDALTKYQLLWDPRAARLSWSIKYAPSGDESKLNVTVNASTGQFVHIEK
jgi:hypothetical protein